MIKNVFSEFEGNNWAKIIGSGHTGDIFLDSNFYNIGINQLCTGKKLFDAEKKPVFR